MESLSHSPIILCFPIKRLRHQHKSKKSEKIYKTNKILKSPFIHNIVSFPKGFIVSKHVGLFSCPWCSWYYAINGQHYTPKISAALCLERWDNWPDIRKLCTFDFVIGYMAVDKAFLIPWTHTWVHPTWANLFPVDGAIWGNTDYFKRTWHSMMWS